jgi:hypothetical protein
MLRVRLDGEHSEIEQKKGGGKRVFRSLRRGEGTGYIGIRTLQVQLLPAAQAAVVQRLEHRTNHPSRRFPPQNYSGVVKVRVTSVERPGECREGREFDTRLLRKKQ